MLDGLVRHGNAIHGGQAPLRVRHALGMEPAIGHDRRFVLLRNLSMELELRIAVHIDAGGAKGKVVKHERLLRRNLDIAPLQRSREVALRDARRFLEDALSTA